MAPSWTPDGAAIVFTADDLGHAAIFRVELADDRVTRLTAERRFSDLQVSPDGTTIYALRSHLDRPPYVVRARRADRRPDRDRAALAGRAPATRCRAAASSSG